MASMTVTYDTGEIRRAAKKIYRCAQSVKESAAPGLKSIRSELPETFCGRTADALSERLEDIHSDVATISNSLESLCRALMKYADALDEADRRIADSL